MKKTAKNKTKRTQGSKTEPVRKITKTGNYTFYVTIPKSLIDELGWLEHQKVVVERKGASLVVRDWKK